LRLAATVPNRAELGDLVRNQLAECRRLGIAVECGVDVDAALVDPLDPADVVVATGSTPQRPWWIAEGVHNVCDVRDVLDGSAEPSGDITVIDEIGFHHATSVAELLADRGHSVDIVTNSMVVGQDLGITLDMEMWWIRAGRKGIGQLTDLVPMGFDGAQLTLLHHPTGTDVVRSPDWVVLAVPPRAADALYHELVASGRRVRRIGDCLAPRRAHSAVIDGERIGVSLGISASRASAAGIQWTAVRVQLVESIAGLQE
jgi:2,4-dienoyl-CoA reductase (NADPH2)